MAGTAPIPPLPPLPPLPPGAGFFYQPPPSSGTSGTFSPAVIAIIGILGAAFLLVSYYTVIAKFCTSREVFRRGRRRGSDEAGDTNEATWPMLTRGLEETIIQAIPVCKYSKSDGLVEGSECAVCLSEFVEDESLRLLPKCSHAFHLPCIDKWLQSHSNCPLCRANVMSPAPRFLPVQPPSVVAILSEDGGNAAQDQPLHSSSEEGNTHPECNNDRTSDPMADDRSSSVRPIAQLPVGETDGEEVDYHHWKRLETLKREDKACARYPDGLLAAEGAMHLAQFRSFSTGRNFGHEGRLHYYQNVHGGYSDPLSHMKRSYSVGCSSKGVGLEYFGYKESCRGTLVDASTYGRSAYETQERQSLPNYEEASPASSATVGVSRVVDMSCIGCGSSSSQSTPRDFKSRSLNHETGLKSKSDIGDPLMGRMLLSLKGPLAVKRSFSGGRLFAFMNSRGKNTVGAANTRPPL